MNLFSKVMSWSQKHIDKNLEIVNKIVTRLLLNLLETKKSYLILSIPKAQLQPIPAFDEPFSRILIDCVSPLPRTKSGNGYLLTIMCTSTRFPEAIPLRNIKTKSIVKALIKFFTIVGLPKSVQSDQGSNFMSGIFQQVMHELGIKQYKSRCFRKISPDIKKYDKVILL